MTKTRDSRATIEEQQSEIEFALLFAAVTEQIKIIEQSQQLGIPASLNFHILFETMHPGGHLPVGRELIDTTLYLGPSVESNDHFLAEPTLFPRLVDYSTAERMPNREDGAGLPDDESGPMLFEAQNRGLFRETFKREAFWGQEAEIWAKGPRILSLSDGKMRSTHDEDNSRVLSVRKVAPKELLTLIPRPMRHA